MKKLLDNKEFLIFLFLGIFGFSNGLFSNYRELWLSSNNLSTNSIANITSIASIITVFIFLMFTLGVSLKKQKEVINMVLVLKMLTGTILLYLNEGTNTFLIKFFTFFDKAFVELILASVYPLILNISKSDITYTKKESIESLFTKIGFLVVSLLLGHTIGTHLFSYNSCLLLSIIFTFLAFIVFINIKVNVNNGIEEFNLKKAFNYLNNHKILYQYFICNALSNIIWASIIGMPILSLTMNLGFAPKTASFIILGFGIITNILALVVVKHFKFKNDKINMFFKYGIRLILYFLIIILNSKVLFLITFLYLLLFDIPYGFLFGSYFINKVPNEYTFLITTFKYCSTLLGNAIGVFICGQVFNCSFRYLVLPALIIGIVHYILGNYILKKREITEF